MIYLLTAFGLTPGGSSTVHIYTQTIHRTTQNKQYIEQHKNIGSLVLAVTHLYRFYPGICLTADEKARKNLGKGSRRVPAGTMKIIKHNYHHQHQKQQQQQPLAPSFMIFHTFIPFCAHIRNSTLHSYCTYTL
jgi:hypothetical protein